eukprot:CAMPEP_0176054914 /NCGR_PEP_ID=MMETSP0120_2-20121206/27329_1 /TAXON_ID=160619 /ORGANISM="Kryptoperidinium foliaceum, Strain CCMP 1326" /LENGTH=271 /DNA_ID=CAMNT_0017388391 /DNA_START=68 /DNA_END=883 /DNA_ORIENTATION=-
MDVRTFYNGTLQVEAKADSHKPVVQAENDKENQDANVPSLPSLVSLTKCNAFMVISVSNCPQCEELGAFLAARGVPNTVFTKWDKSSKDYPELKKQLSTHAGATFTFPQVFANGSYQGGFKEVMNKADRGVYDELFEREFGVEPTTLLRWVERRPMVIFSLPNCPQCDVLYNDMKKRGVPVQDVFEKLDKASPEYATLKAQMQKLIGKQQFAFPQTFVRGVYQGDYDQVIAKADGGDFEDFFSEQFGIGPPAKVNAEALPPMGAMAFDDDF